MSGEGGVKASDVSAMLVGGGLLYAVEGGIPFTQKKYLKSRQFVTRGPPPHFWIQTRNLY